MAYQLLISLLALMYSPTPHGGLRFDPPVIHATRDSTGYVQAMVSAYSQHGDSIRITGISGSCQCGTASVQRALAHDTVPAKFYVAINAKHFTDTLNYVDYTLTTTGHGATYRVAIHVKK